MRSLNSLLLAEQKTASLELKYKVNLVLGADDQTYQQGELIGIDHTEQEFDQRASLIIWNKTGAIATLFKGYKVTLSYGMLATGAKYSAVAPMWVTNAQYVSASGEIFVVLECQGIPNLMAQDHAEVAYAGLGSTDTVKTLLTAIVNGTLTAFDHTQTYSATFDSEDDLIDAFIPAEAFNFAVGTTRIEAIKQLLFYTKSRMRAEADGKIHFFVPTQKGRDWVASTAYALNDYVTDPTSPANNFAFKCTTAGTSGVSEPAWPTVAGNTVSDSTVVWTAIDFEYEYHNQVSLEHNFWKKATNDPLMMPNKVTVRSHPDDDDSFTGTDEFTEHSDISQMEKEEFFELSLVSNAQAKLVAGGILRTHEGDMLRGMISAPINVGAEVWDLIKIVDSRTSGFDVTSQIQNVSSVQRIVAPGRWRMNLTFGTIAVGGLNNILALTPPTFRPRKRTATAIQDQKLRAAMSIIDDEFARLDEIILDLTDSLNNAITTINMLIQEVGDIRVRVLSWSKDLSKLVRTAVTGSTYTVKDTDELIGLSRLGTITVTLPSAAALIAGRAYVFNDERRSAATDNYTIGTEGTETIDGASTFVMNQDGQSVTIYSDGTNWHSL